MWCKNFKNVSTQNLTANPLWEMFCWRRRPISATLPANLPFTSVTLFTEWNARGVNQAPKTEKLKNLNFPQSLE